MNVYIQVATGMSIDAYDLRQFLIKSDFSLEIFSEENIWKLCQMIRDNHSKYGRDITDFDVVFISNQNEQVFTLLVGFKQILIQWFQTVIFKQKCGNEKNDYLVVWDYHVILIDRKELLVYDMDTVLEFPCPFDIYFNGAIRHDISKSYERLFRVIPAPEYLRQFLLYNVCFTD